MSRLAEVFSSLVLSLLLIRALHPTLYGQYSFVVNAASFGAVLLSLGFAETLMRFVSALLGTGQIAEVRLLVRWLLGARLITYAAGILLLFILHGVAARLLHLPLIDRFWLPIALLLVSQGAIEFTTSYAYARLRSRDVAVARTVGQVLAVAFFGVIVALRLQDPVTAAITVSISYLAAAALLIVRGLGSVLVSGSSTTLPLRRFVNFALMAWAVNLFTLGLAGQIDVILLGALRRDFDQIAFYSVATLVFVKLGVLLSGWAGTAISNFAEIRVRRGPEVASRLFNVYMRINLLISLLVYPPILLMARPIAVRVFGASYAPTADLMTVYGAFWLVSSCLAAGIPLSVMMAIGAQRQALLIRAATGIANVVLDLVLIPPLGALGAIIATGIANVLAHLADFMVAAIRVGGRYPGGLLLRGGAAALLGLIVPFLLHPSGLLLTGVGFLLYWIVFAGTLLVIRPLEAGDLELASRVSPRVGSIARRFTAVG
ncbi:MAG TPA: polysaccharide biosynthesis C-terminal domain-containing protein [Candidatus Sulfotelmatobacter sp.]|nr:polysaccharide biosynthesis C-terminal domain-containing protein [Candidatus Sulfotelmatobacter sp.]